MPGIARGNLLEGILAGTRYVKFEWLDKVSSSFKGIDFWRNGLGVSLKTVGHETSAVPEILQNIEDLADMARRGVAQDGRRITAVRLDIMVPEGYDRSLLDKVKEKAKEYKIPIKVFDSVDPD